MAAIDFPDSPEVNDIFTAGDRSWKWSGVAWQTVTTRIGATGPTGPIGPDGSFLVSTDEPESPIEGDVWYNSVTGQMFIYYDSFWVESNNSIVGATGPTGPTGPEGGPTGPTGPTGPEGQTGPTGLDGADGPPGKFIASPAQPDPLTAEEGDAWFDTASFKTYVFYEGSFVEVISGNAGPQGPTGPEGGPTGPTGPTGPEGPAGGPTGPTGATGAAGPTGAQGPVGDIGNLNATSPIIFDSETANISFDSSSFATVESLEDFATIEYVENLASGIISKPSVLFATASNLNATYDNGTSGVGATLTSNTNGALTATDVILITQGAGVLVKSQTNKAHNGRYVVEDLGSASEPWVLRRCSLCDEADEIPGSYIFVQDGTFQNTGWVLSVADPASFVVGADNIDVYQFSGAGTYTAGSGITLSGTEFSANSTIARLDSPTFTGTVSLPASTNGLLPAGAITQFAGAAAPTGYLLCTGQSVSTTTFASLFSAIGYTYGGSGGFFNVPNLQNRVPVGKGSGTFATLNSTGGAETHTLTVEQMPSHTHTQNPHNHGAAQDAYTYWNGGVQTGPGGSGLNHPSGLSLGSTTANATAVNQNTGGGAAHNNLQPYIVLNYIIKT
jgi:microcystin-dependent protein/3D (Asp-Asp-Asp) domain-containing protein